jgi:eukaryotic-like serine/threonine-protein kinase
MSPEQAMGERAITARSDIYSLGTVTYEMLSGEPPFTGPTAQAIVARIMTEEPRPLRAQRRNVPPHIEAAVSRALEKVPADRFASAREFAEALNNPSFKLSSVARTAVERDQRRHRSWMLYAVIGIALLMTGAAILGWMRPSPSKAVLQYSLALDSTEAIVPGADFWTRVALSPDGSRLAYIGGARAQLMIRLRNQLHATAVPGTEGAYTPFFSPDGSHIGLLREKKIEIVSINGGQPVELSDSLVGVAGASWGRDGFIYADGAGYISLVRVEAKPGAVAKSFTALDTVRGDVYNLWPDLLPN